MAANACSHFSIEPVTLSMLRMWCAMRRTLRGLLQERTLWACVLLGIFFLGPVDMAISAAQSLPTATSSDRSVKAAFIYKFLGYVEWPQQSAIDPNAPLTIGVLEAEEIAADLAHLTAGRKVGQRPIRIKTLREADDTSGLQVLFIGGDSAQHARLLRAAQQNAILTISESDSLFGLGSIINFKLVDDRVRFEVSLDAAEKSNVKLSARLLTVAHRVQKAVP